MSRNPSSILYDAYGNTVATLDGYELISISPGYPIMSKNLSNKAVFVKSNSDGYVYISSPILENIDFATETTLLDSYNRLVNIEEKDFATEATLSAIKDTDGIKSIVDPVTLTQQTIADLTFLFREMLVELRASRRLLEFIVDEEIEPKHLED